VIAALFGKGQALSNNVWSIFGYLRDTFPTARFVDPANSNNGRSLCRRPSENQGGRRARSRREKLERNCCMTWSLPKLLAGLHEDMEARLSVARKAFAHAPTKGDASEKVWLDLFRTYLPERYSAETAHVVDNDGNFSDQIDVVIFDRQYTPFIFNFEGQVIIPAESVYAVFEAKQTINAALVSYARAKAASIRRLKRTSLPIPHAGGTYAPTFEERASF
jgi:hypothetical protein